MTNRTIFIFIILFSIQALKTFGQMTPKVVYGDDNRVEMYELEGTLWAEKARSVAMRVLKDTIYKEDRNHIGLFKKNLNLCFDQRFAEQKAVGSCSGFLIAPNILITAGHCVQSELACQNIFWIFDFQLKNESDTDYLIVNKKRVYHCKKILSQFFNPRSGKKLDYALIELDRIVSDRAPLEFRKTGKIENGTPLSMIGHPDGLPMKFTDDALVSVNRETEYFSAPLDSFHSNSGSPVFNYETGKVEGILVRGQQDYVKQTGCKRVNVMNQNCLGDKCNWEDVTRILAVKDILKY